EAGSERDKQQILQRQRREERELQARIQAMKHTVPKNDKKRRKQLLQEMAHLEAKMEEKHQQELELYFERRSRSTNVDSVTDELARMALENQSLYLSRAQRRHERKAAHQQEHQERIEVLEMEDLASYRREEEEKLAAILRAKNLEMKNIPADGHCMYRAIQDQLMSFVTVDSLRHCTSEYMQKHVDDFLPFFSNPNICDGCARADFLKYCQDIVRRASWGTQLELRALSHILQTRIEVIRADSPALIIGEEYNTKPLTLVYLRHACVTGEHYNSVKLVKATGAEAAGPEVMGASAAMTPRHF
uniref:ubiquitinyl hydrolase 1 n=1 Tax=Oryctolagus cuniculus TaxID=9986 RepID=G1SSI0_RABIT